MLRIVAMADTHSYHDDLDVPDGDVLIHAGDLTRSGSLEELEAAHAFLARQPHPHKLVVAGNHERCLEDQPDAARRILTDVTYLQDEAVSIGGVSFYGSPWQPAFHSWAFNVERGPELAQRWALIPQNTDVLVTHAPPIGIGDRIAEDHRAGCADLLHRVLTVQPKLHLFGHIHTDRGRWNLAGVTFANVTTDECTKPVSVFDYV